MSARAPVGVSSRAERAECGAITSSADAPGSARRRTFANFSSSSLAFSLPHCLNPYSRCLSSLRLGASRRRSPAARLRRRLRASPRACRRLRLLRRRRSPAAKSRRRRATPRPETRTARGPPSARTSRSRTHFPPTLAADEGLGPTDPRTPSSPLARSSFPSTATPSESALLVLALLSALLGTTADRAPDRITESPTLFRATWDTRPPVRMSTSAVTRAVPSLRSP